MSFPIGWRKTAIPLAVLVALAQGMASCGTETDAALAVDDGSVPSADELYQQPVTLWPKASGVVTVPVCFRPIGSTGRDCGGNPYTVNYSNSVWMARRTLVQEALVASWQRWTSIVFTGFGTCGASLGGKIYMDLVSGDVGGAGCSGYGYDPSNGTGISFWLDGDELRARSVVMHEVGHALGFHHEQDRGDAEFPGGTPKCKDGRDEFNGGTALTSYYDDVSIMNYCAPYSRNSLSSGDIEGSQKIYGTSKAGRWLKALPALAAYTL